MPQGKARKKKKGKFSIYRVSELFDSKVYNHFDVFVVLRKFAKENRFGLTEEIFQHIINGDEVRIDEEDVVAAVKEYINLLKNQSMPGIGADENWHTTHEINLYLEHAVQEIEYWKIKILKALLEAIHEKIDEGDLNNAVVLFTKLLEKLPEAAIPASTRLNEPETFGAKVEEVNITIE